MGRQNDNKSSKVSLKNPSAKRKPLAPKAAKTKRTKKKKKDNDIFHSSGNNQSGSSQNNDNIKQLRPSSASDQLRFFLDQFQSAKGVQLSSLEWESLKETSILELPQDSNEDVKFLGRNVKAAFGQSWKEVLCEGQLVEGKINPGNPAVLIISSSALRCIELLRGFGSLTKECRAVKLFAKHMKVEEQNLGNDAKNLKIFAEAPAMLSGYILHSDPELSLVDLFTSDKGLEAVTGNLALCLYSIHKISLLKNRVNIACGTPSRIKKLIDTEALGLSRIQVLLLDMHPDVKGYSLFTLPQVSDEFWDLFKTYFYQPMVQGDLRICLYGPYHLAVRSKGKRRHNDTVE